MPYIQGRIEQIIHHSDGYFVVAMKVLESDSIIRDKEPKISGYLCGLRMLRNGICLRVTGDWVAHPKWGRQLSPSGWQPWCETDHDRVRFLNECVEGFSD